MFPHRLPRRSFLAFLAALPGLRLLPAGPARLSAYVPSFLHPNDRWVVLRSDRGFGLTILDLETGREVQRIASDPWGTLYGEGGLYFDPSGRFLVLGHHGKHLSFLVRWDLEQGGAERAFSLEKARRGDDATIPDRQSDGLECPPFQLPQPGGILRLPDSDWSLATFRLIRRRVQPLAGAFLAPPFGPLWVTSIGKRFWEVLREPGERWAEIRSQGGRVRVTRSPSVWMYGEAFGAHPARVAARRTRDSVLVWSGYSTVREYDASSRELLRCVSATMPQTGLLAFGGDRDHLLAARPLGTAVAWNRKGSPTQVPGSIALGIAKPPIQEMGVPLPESTPESPVYSKECRALAAGVSRIALGFDGGEVMLGEGKEAHGGPWSVLGRHPDAVRAMAFTADEALLLTGARDGSLRLWDISERRLRMELPAHGARVNACAIAGARAATAGPDGVRLWDLRDGTRKGVLATDGVWVSDVAWSPDGTTVAGALLDGTLRVWDARSGELLWRVQADKGWCAAVAFHPTEPWIASGHELGTVALWNVTNGDPIRGTLVEARTAWQSGTRPVHALAWSRDGMALAAAFGDAVRVYDRNLTSSGGSGWILPLDWADEYT